MSMYLHIELPHNLITRELIQQKNIPCLCRIAKDFEIMFQNPLPEAIGLVRGWDRRLLEERAIAGGGGHYTHYEFGMVTLKEGQPNEYKIVDLAFFYTSFGWCQILSNGEYTPPGNFWDDESDDTIGR